MKQRTQLGRLLALCLSLLVAAFLTVQVAHSHDLDSGGENSGHCPICLLAHVSTGAQAVVSIAAPMPFQSCPVVSEPCTGSPVIAFNHVSRPPPVSSSFLPL